MIITSGAGTTQVKKKPTDTYYFLVKKISKCIKSNQRVVLRTQIFKSDII